MADMTDTERLAEVIATCIKAAIAPLRERIAVLESRPSLKDCGVWHSGVVYENGSLVTFDGSAWVCRQAHFAVGDHPSHDHFRLLVKRGRDGRDR
jgi:hypothetical protein